MQSTQPTVASTYERRVRRMGEPLALETHAMRRGRRNYTSPELELLADFGEGGTEPIRLQD